MSEDEANEVEDCRRNAGGLLRRNDRADTEVALEADDGGEGGDEFGGGGGREESVCFVECCGRDRQSVELRKMEEEGRTDDLALATRVGFKEQAQHDVEERARCCFAEERVREVDDGKATGGEEGLDASLRSSGAEAVEQAQTESEHLLLSLVEVLDAEPVDLFAKTLVCARVVRQSRREWRRGKDAQWNPSLP